MEQRRAHRRCEQRRQCVVQPRRLAHRLHLGIRSDRGVLPTHGDLYTVPWNDRACGTATPVTGASGSDVDEFFPAFSPDDQLISFASFPVGDGIAYDNPMTEVSVIPSGGGSAVRLAKRSAGMQRANQPRHREQLAEVGAGRHDRRHEDVLLGRVLFAPRDEHAADLRDGRGGRRRNDYHVPGVLRLESTRDGEQPHARVGRVPDPVSRLDVSLLARVPYVSLACTALQTDYVVISHAADGTPHFGFVEARRESPLLDGFGAAFWDDGLLRHFGRYDAGRCISSIIRIPAERARPVHAGPEDSIRRIYARGTIETLSPWSDDDSPTSTDQSFADWVTEHVAAVQTCLVELRIVEVHTRDHVKDRRLIMSKTLLALAAVGSMVAMTGVASARPGGGHGGGGGGHFGGHAASGHFVGHGGGHYAGHMYAARGYAGHGYVGHGYVGHGYVGHGYVGHGYVGHGYVGRGYGGHGYWGPRHHYWWGWGPAYISPYYYDPYYADPYYADPYYVDPSYTSPQYVDPSYVNPPGDDDDTNAAPVPDEPQPPPQQQQQQQTQPAPAPVDPYSS